jgi:hypothetical protein
MKSRKELEKEFWAIASEQRELQRNKGLGKYISMEAKKARIRTLHKRMQQLNNVLDNTF